MHYHWQKIRLSLSHAKWLARMGVRRSYQVFRSRWVVLPLFAFLTAMVYGRYITNLNFFVFHDNGEMIVHETYETNVLAAMEEAGIYLKQGDSYAAPVQSVHGSAAEVVIERSYLVTAFFDGRSFTVPTQGETVASVLRRADYKPQAGDIVQPSLETRTSPNMEIRVYRTEVTYEYETETVDYDVIERTNKNLNEKARIVVQPGVSGSRTKTYELTWVEGEIVDRALVKTIETDPVDEIVEKGVRKTVTMRNGEVLNYSRRLECTATAYTTENRTRKVNALGNVARAGTIAVDRTIIPLKSMVYVCSRDEGKSWEYGKARCEDVGGFRGYHVDLFYDQRDTCIQFGKRKCLVYVLE